jgi:4-amino-4-deoxy-L-arabinose transferase-like glycosyltransferase
MLVHDDWLRDLLLLTLLLGIFFAFNLGKRALWSPDEGRYSEVAREMVVSGDYVTPRLNGVKFFEKPPLFYWLQSFAIKTFGLDEWSLRLWPATFAVFCCLVVYAAGRRIFGRRSAMIAAVVLATTGLHYAMSRIANLDMELSTFLTCALLAFLWGTREPPGPKRRGAMWAFYIFAGLAVLQKGLIGIVIPGLIIGSWMLVFDQRKILKTMHLSSGLMLFVAVAAPWHILVSAANPEFLNFYFVREHFHRFLYQTGTPFDRPWTFVPVLLIGLFPWTTFLFPAIKHSLYPSLRPRHGFEEAAFLALWAGWVLLFFSFSSSKVIPYILPMFPPLSMLIGRYFSAAWHQPDLEGIRAGFWTLLIVIAVAIGTGVGSLQHYFERYSNWPILEVPAEETTLASNSLTAFPDMIGLKPYIVVQSAALLTGALAAIYLRKRRGFPAAFGAWAASAALFLMILDSSLPIFDDRRSVKDLALAMKPYLGAKDEVATFHAYYQDLPLYLHRHITQIGWIESFELWDEDLNRQAFDDMELWRKWAGPQSIFVVTDRSTYDKLRATGSRLMYLIAQNSYEVVFSNKRPLASVEPKSASIN